MILESARDPKTGISVVPVSRANVDAVNGLLGRNGAGLAHGWPGVGSADTGSTIRTGDRLNVTIWDTATDTLLNTAGAKSTTLQGIEVDTSGKISLPYADKIALSGKTTDQARDIVLEKLRGSMPTAEVQIQRQSGRMNSVSLVSGVPSPGTVALESSGLTTLGLISHGGGISGSLTNPVVRILRGTAVYETWASDLLAGRSADVQLRGGDRVLVVPDSRTFTAVGATGTERVVEFDEAKISAMNALAMAGGLNESRADLKGILILREHPPAVLASAVTQKADAVAPSGDAIYVLDLTTADGLFAARTFDIRPGDTVMATESPIVSAQTVLGLTGLLFRTGNTVGVGP